MVVRRERRIRDPSRQTCAKRRLAAIDERPRDFIDLSRRVSVTT